MAADQITRVPYADGCPSCLRKFVAPAVATRVGADSMVCRYECVCGHLWRTSWSVGFVEGWAEA